MVDDIWPFIGPISVLRAGSAEDVLNAIAAVPDLTPVERWYSYGADMARLFEWAPSPFGGILHLQAIVSWPEPSDENQYPIPTCRLQFRTVPGEAGPGDAGDTPTFPNTLIQADGLVNRIAIALSRAFGGRELRAFRI